MMPQTSHLGFIVLNGFKRLLLALSTRLMLLYILVQWTDLWDEADVHAGKVLLLDAELELTERFHKLHALYVTHCAAKLKAE